MTTAYKAGQHGNFYWIEFSENNFDLSDLLRNYPGILEDKYLAIVCFDSGPLGLLNEEKDMGWYEKDGIAYSPRLKADLITVLPSEQHDQWCLFPTATEFTRMTDFVNYGRFTLGNRKEELDNADPTWDKVGIAKMIETHRQLLYQFWEELTQIDPVNFIADGDNFIFISKDTHEIDLLKNGR